MDSPRVVVITGMHHSGTSMVASLIQQAGVMIGDRLLPADDCNPRGYFEDMEFRHFHRDLLRRQGLTPPVSDPAALRPPSGRDGRRALALIARRRDHDLWAFKDPCASLFLDFWSNLLENDAYIFLYRRPVDVVLSLVRRGSDVAILADPMIALEAWKTYNRKVFEFVSRHQERCVLCDIYGVGDDVDAFATILERKLNLRLDFAGTGEFLAPDELTRVEEFPVVEELLTWIDPEAAELGDKLRQLADLPGQQQSPDDDPEALRSLTTVVNAVRENSEQREAMRGPLFALLVALVPPLTSGQALRSRLLGLLCRNETIRLGDRLERLQREFDGRIENTEKVEAEQHQTLQRLIELQTEFDERTKWALELDIRVEERQAAVCELQAQLDERHRQLAELDNHCAAQELRLLDLEERLLDRDG